MKVCEILNNAKKPIFSFELLPPLKGGTIDEIFKTIDNLVDFQPACINVTYHQHQVEYVEREDGLIEKKVVQKRPGTVAISAAIKNKYEIPVVPHLICGGFTREDTEDALIDLNFLGIDNVLALRGDPIPGEKRFKPEPGDHAHADELVKQIVDMNNGTYLNPNLKNSKPSNFSIGVAGYPEKHYESPNLDVDIQWLKHKVEKGADYIVTQMFFDNAKYFRFVERCRKMGIEIPIVPGIKPISAFSDIRLIPRAFYIDIPNELFQHVKNSKTREQVKKAGISWAIKQCHELMEYGVPGIHFFTLGETDHTRQIVKEVF
jgi:methylenetetrahydrofolate reductase (NADPH)